MVYYNPKQQRFFHCSYEFTESWYVKSSGGWLDGSHRHSSVWAKVTHVHLTKILLRLVQLVANLARNKILPLPPHLNSSKARNGTLHPIAYRTGRLWSNTKDGWRELIRRLGGVVLCNCVHPSSSPLQSVGTQNNCSSSARAEIPWNSFIHRVICENGATPHFHGSSSARRVMRLLRCRLADETITKAYANPISPSWWTLKKLERQTDLKEIRAAMHDTFILSSKTIWWNHVVYADDHGLVLQKDRNRIGSSGSPFLVVVLRRPECHRD